MYKLCTTQKTSTQQRQFTDCLLDSLKDAPFHEISVCSLCEKTGLSRRTFYRLFGSKEDVLCALVDNCLIMFDSYSTPEQPAVCGAPGELVRFFSYWKSQKAVLDALSENHKGALLIQRSMLYIAQEQSGTMRWLGAMDHPKKHQILLFFISGLMGLVIDWHHSGYADSVEETAETAFQLLSNPPLRLPIPPEYT